MEGRYIAPSPARQFLGSIKASPSGGWALSGDTITLSTVRSLDLDRHIRFVVPDFHDAKMQTFRHADAFHSAVGEDSEMRQRSS